MTALQQKARACETLSQLAALIPESEWTDTKRELFAGMVDCGPAGHRWQYVGFEEDGCLVALRTCRCCGRLDDGSLELFLDSLRDEVA